MGVMRACLIIACLLLSASTAKAIECRTSPPPGDSNHWAWRQIDNKKCWYAGEPGMDKSKLHWAPSADRAPGADRAPEPAQRVAPEMSQSAESEPWSTFGMGLTVLASDIDWGSRWQMVGSESSTNATEVGAG